VAELEDDLRALVAGRAEGLDAARLRRARRAAAWIAAREGELRARGLLSFGERVGDLHIAPELEAALAAATDADADADAAAESDADSDSDADH
jgi:hypothetical protein